MPQRFDRRIASGASQKPVDSRQIDRPFIISFNRKLEKGYTFRELQKNDLKALQGFLDIAAELSMDAMVKLYRRMPDKDDRTDDHEPIEHYGTGNGFRLHGVSLGERFEVIRIDPNHKVHD